MDLFRFTEKHSAGCGPLQRESAAVAMECGTARFYELGEFIC